MEYTEAELQMYLDTVAKANNPKDYAYVPDPEKVSTWKLPLVDDSGKMTARQVGMAVAALGPGFRGEKVQIPADALPAVKAKVRAAWKQVNPDKSDKDMPSSIKKEVSMTQEELEKKLTDMEGQLSTAVSKVQVLEDIGKAYQELETEDRDVFATLSKEQQEEFVGADTTDTRKEEILTKRREEIAKAEQGPDLEDLSAPVRKRLEDIEKRALDAEAKAKAMEDKVAKANEQIAKAEDTRFLAECIAKAEKEFGNYPVSKDEMGAILKSLHCPCLAADQREAIEKVFASGNEALAQLQGEVGKSSGESATSAWGQIEKRAQAIAKEKAISVPAATEQFLKTDEGQKLYEESLRETVRQ